MTNIYNIINNTTELREINDILYEAQKQKIRILNELWEDCYKERCPLHYISFSDFVKDIKFWNETEYKDPKIISFQKDYYDASYPMYISDIMDLCRRYNFKQLGHKVSEMICEACVCKDCSCMEEYLHSSCAECKKDFYKMYSGYCGYCDN